MNQNQKYYLWILGCAMNYSDAERIASVFDAAGYQITSKETEADIVVTVACSVRQHAIDRIYGKAKGWERRKRRNPKFKTILTGCVLPEDNRKLQNSFDLIFKIEEIGKLENFLEISNQNSKLKTQNSTKDYLSLTPKYESNFRAFVPIMTGCDNFCSYCAVPYTRGREKSRPADDIVAEIRDLVAKGYREITLLGQNVNSFGVNNESKASNNKKCNRFLELLKQIDKIDGDYRVYFYSNHPKDFSPELIKALPTLKHFPAYIHLPLQSGNDEILRQMNRRYTATQYLDLVSRIRAAIPNVILTTDVIVGFPGEGEAEYDDTLKVIREAKFEMIFIGQYSPRAGTPSAKMVDNIPKEAKKERERIITDLLRDNLEETNKKYVGQTLRILVDGEKNGKYYGRSEGYKVIEVKTDQPLQVGRFYETQITGSGAWKLIGEVS